MEEVCDLGDNIDCGSAELPLDADCEFGTNFLGTQTTQPSRADSRRGRGRTRGRSSIAKSLPGLAQSPNVVLHKLRGPNWTEEEMLVLIGQKRIEWDGRHNCSQPNHAKFVYGTMAWKIVLAGCMAEVGFRARDADQLTNKWDGLIKDYKKLKEHVEGTVSANWWGMNREEKRHLCKNRKLPLEFSERIYNEMESFVGKRQIFGRATDVVDSDCMGSPPPVNVPANGIPLLQGLEPPEE